MTSPLRPSGFLAECFHTPPPDAPTPVRHVRYAADTPDAAVRWMRISLRTIGSQPLEPAAGQSVWQWIQEDHRGALEDLRAGRPVALAIESQGHRLRWTIRPVAPQCHEVNGTPVAGPEDTPSARVPAEQRDMHPPGPPGGIRVAYLSTVTDFGPDSALIREDGHVELPGQAMRWIRRRVRAMAALMDAEGQCQAAAWLADTAALYDVLTWLSAGIPYACEWTAGSVHVQFSASPAQLSGGFRRRSANDPASQLPSGASAGRVVRSRTGDPQ